MSIAHGRLAVPAFSASSHRHPFRLRHGRFLTAVAKQTTKATPCPPEDGAQISSPSSTSFSFPAFHSLSSNQKDQISLYVRTLLQWNQRMNLTAVTEEREVMSRHVEDSLAILPPLRRSYLSHCCSSSPCDGLNVVDVGSGAGLPGLILAIACPRQNVGQSIDYRELFDVAVARAVAEMRTLAEYCLPLVRVGGLFVAAKGSDPQEEVKSAGKAIQLMGASIIELCTVESHSPKGQRTTVICLKDRATPKRFPRHPGIPTKSPL
ncbi:hypothetical protein C4D60_Mb09t17020 [Musa balbisiana]|uniref:Ribosomal RNA small subunit methyltransferase G n=1 Tax=Musa balbisiana TaxID=52838 RepID=A0A4S8IH23_MUSBA|nr:hypothetical protein C4D60_Mb09t17020 [Musa balbisiana]